jgi:acetyl esterase
VVPLPRITPSTIDDHPVRNNMYRKLCGELYLRISDEGAWPGLNTELAQALEKSAQLLRQTPLEGVGVTALRRQMREAGAWWNEGGPSMQEERRVRLPATGRTLDGVLYRPSDQADLPVYVFLHGGGFRFGDESASAFQVRAIARAWGGCVLSLDYPHIPEAPFPAAVEAIGSAYRWLAANGAKWALDGSRIAFGGASAGANVSCGAAVAIGGAARNAFLRAAALIVQVFDNASDTASMQNFGDGPHFPTRAAAEETWRDYLVDRTHDADPRANLMLAAPDQFPATFMAAAEYDVFRDGAARMAERLTAAGGVVDHRVYEGMTHLFFGFARMVATSRRCAADLAAFLQRDLPVAQARPS